MSDSEVVDSIIDKLTGNWWKKYIPYVLVFSLGLGLGAWAMHSWYISDLRAALASVKEKLNNTEQLLYTERQKPPVIKTETKTVTQMAYVPKETIIYRDSTGQTTAVQEKTDVELTVPAPALYMKYNNQLFEMQGITGEKTKFEQGKLTGEINSAATIDVTDLVNKEVALQRENDTKVLNKRLAELTVQKRRPQIDLFGGADTVGIGIRVNRIGLDYMRTEDHNKVLLRYTVVK
ncbi:MAG: hypothetical protein H6Q72_3390 [Firmicutes bacterium]|nr:hypothetical protein [Bacillota bacterium]